MHDHREHLAPTLNGSCQYMKAKQPLICDVMRSPEECMLTVAESINRAHKETSGVCVVLENVAGGVRYQLLPLRHALLTLTVPWYCGDTPQDAYSSTFRASMQEAHQASSFHLGAAAIDHNVQCHCRLSGVNDILSTLCREAVRCTALGNHAGGPGVFPCLSGHAPGPPAMYLL